MPLLRRELAWGSTGCAECEEVFAVEYAWMAGVRIECWHQRWTISHDADACVAMPVNATLV